MRRLAAILISAVAFVSVAAAAKAADQPVVKAKPIRKAAPPPPAPPAPSGSTGFYVGINGGYDWGRASFSNAIGTSSVRVPSGLFGLTLGYNAQAGSFVYGLETDIDYAWLKSTNFTSPPCFGCEVRMRYFGTLRGRVGYAVDSALPYFTGGLAYAGISTGRPALGTRETDDTIGWTIGAGVEYAFLGPWSAKLEYLYFELDRADCSAATCVTPVSVKLKGNLVRAGINYRF